MIQGDWRRSRRRRDLIQVVVFELGIMNPPLRHFFFFDEEEEEQRHNLT
jgi:hypothetical protein